MISFFYFLVFLSLQWVEAVWRYSYTSTLLWCWSCCRFTDWAWLHPWYKRSVFCLALFVNESAWSLWVGDCDRLQAITVMLAIGLEARYLVRQFSSLLLSLQMTSAHLMRQFTIPVFQEEMMMWGEVHTFVRMGWLPQNFLSELLTISAHHHIECLHAGY